MGLAAPILYSILYSKRWCNGHYSRRTSSGVHTVELYSSTALYNSTALCTTPQGTGSGKRLKRNASDIPKISSEFLCIASLVQRLISVVQ